MRWSFSGVRARSLCALFALAAIVFLPGTSAANNITYTTVPGSDGQGPVSATINIAAISGGLAITITNTQSGKMHLGQAVSGLSFTVAGLSTPTAFTSLSGETLNLTGAAAGSTWTLANGTPFSGGPGPIITHWGFSTSGSNVSLATAGTSAPKPPATYMILPSSGIVEGGLPNGKFNPFFIGPTVFDLTVPGVTSNTTLSSTNFINMLVDFGTDPDVILPVVPEPSSLLLMGSIFGGAIGLGLLRKLSRNSAQQYAT
jgi:hypothetical protein